MTRPCSRQARPDHSGAGIRFGVGMPYDIKLSTQGAVAYLPDDKSAPNPLRTLIVNASHSR